MLDKPSVAIAIVHQSGIRLSESVRDRLTTQAWRVKNWEEHPMDPGWEDGRYCLCHARFRNSTQRKVGEIVVDCVNTGGATTQGYVVRSFFKIREITQDCPFQAGGHDLLFESYHFCDGRPYRLRCGTIGLRAAPLSARSLRQLLTHSSYREYKVSFERGPESIAKGDWKEMAERKFEAKTRLPPGAGFCCP